MDAKRVQFLDAVAKWVLFLGFFGLFNLKEVGRFENKVSYVVCPIKTIFSVLFVILYSSFFYVQLTYGDGIFYDHLYIKSLNFFISYSTVPGAILILLTTLLYSKDCAILLTDIICCEFTFYKNYSAIIDRKTTTLLLSFITTTLISLTCDFFRLYYENWSFILILNLIASYIFSIYSVVSVLHFSMIQFWIHGSFLRINLDLTNSLKNYYEYLKAAKRTENTIRGDILSELVLTDAKTFNRANDIFRNRPKNMKSIEEQIKDLRIKYNDVFKISRKCDEVYSSRNLVVVATNLIMSVIVLFFTMQFIREYWKNPAAITGMDVISSLKGSMLCLTSIMGLVWSCGTTCEEAKKTALIIQDNIIHAENKDLKTQLKDFANQVLHENVYFSPHGFFVLQNGMLLSILSAVASYLVILLQFHPVYNYTHKDIKDEAHFQ